MTTKEIKYRYRNLPIPGGGYVTGFLYHKYKKNLLYLRTDIGGTYRFDAGQQTWKSLISHVTPEDLSETYPISIALDDNYPNRLYIACGENRTSAGVLAVSEDYGEHFTYEKIPVLIHGNLNGRGTGERLIVDAKNSEKLYFASQRDGLWISKDRGRTWEKAESLPEDYLTFAGFVGELLLVGTAGVTTEKEDGSRGHSLYYSRDCGKTFLELEEPASRRIAGCRKNGQVAQRFCVDEDYLYVTFASTGRRSYVIEDGYSCDSGDVLDGHIVRYPILEDKTLGKMEDITPGAASKVKGVGLKGIQKGEMLEYGFSGIDVSRKTKGMLIATTIVKDDGDSVFLSYDAGATWQQILYGLDEGTITFRAPYMRPECNGGESLIHWLSDIKINPFDDNEAWFNSGTGVFRTRSLKENDCAFTDWCDGIEETVHLNVYSLPGVKTRVVDILGDLGGFLFEDLTKPCDNSFADAEGNRYITCINADYCENDPDTIIVTPRGNWKGKTKGGLILSKDGGKTFERLAMPFGISEEIDKALREIEHPNVNSGWVAISPDGNNIVWSIADMITLPFSRVVASTDGGATFQKSRVFSKEGVEQKSGTLKVFSDRKRSGLFYGFGGNGQLYISRDGGIRFYETGTVLSGVDFGKIDCTDKTEIRADAGADGVFYIAAAEHGLLKLGFKEDGLVQVTHLGAKEDIIYRVGLGIGAGETDYRSGKKVLYCNGVIDGTYGFYRTQDEGLTWERINTKRQMYGEINSIDGDKQKFGRFYLATGSNGILYGEEE